MSNPAFGHTGDAAARRVSRNARVATGRYDAVQPTPFGAVGVRTLDEAILELVFLQGDPALAAASPSGALAGEACRQIAAYMQDAAFAFDLPLALDGTPYQRRVWSAIGAIPGGKTRTYGELAAELQSAPRAVGQACGANRFPLVIPCHRVVAAAGLGGFAHQHEGFLLRVKRWLLAHEAQ